MNVQFFDTEQSGDQIIMDGQEVWAEGRTWRRVDLTGKTEIHLAGFVTGVGGNGGTVILECRPDGSNAFGSTGASISASSSDIGKPVVGATVSIPAAMTCPGWLRIGSALGATGDEVTFYTMQAIAA